MERERLERIEADKIKLAEYKKKESEKLEADQFLLAKSQAIKEAKKKEEKAEFLRKQKDKMNT